MVDASTPMQRRVRAGAIGERRGDRSPANQSPWRYSWRYGRAGCEWSSRSSPGWFKALACLVLGTQLDEDELVAAVDVFEVGEKGTRFFPWLAGDAFSA